MAITILGLKTRDTEGVLRQVPHFRETNEDTDGYKLLLNEDCSTDKDTEYL